jgi:hypothetical protein
VTETGFKAMVVKGSVLRRSKIGPGHNPACRREINGLLGGEHECVGTFA